MMAKLYDKAFNDPGWIFEIKWDGYRAVAELSGKDIRLYSRNGLSFEDKYPLIFNELQKIKKKAVIDGEIVALDKDGKPSFQLLQQYDPATTPLVYYVFDCLEIKGKSIKNKTLLERKEELKKILPEDDSIIRYCDHVAETGKEFFGLTAGLGLEGMIAKKSERKISPGQAD